MLECRSTESELLDRSDLEESLARRSYQFMYSVNRYLGGRAVVRQFLQACAARHPAGRPLRVLDIGSGGCDIPLALCPWGRRRGLELDWTCLDLSPMAVALANENIRKAAEPRVRALQEDVLTHRPEAPYDCAVGSLFFHHLSDEGILELIARLRPVVRGPLLINDLHRSAAACLVCRVFTLPLPEIVRHDPLVSIRRGFRMDELRRLLERSGGRVVTVRRHWLFRIMAVLELA